MSDESDSSGTPNRRRLIYAGVLLALLAAGNVKLENGRAVFAGIKENAGLLINPPG